MIHVLNQLDCLVVKLDIIHEKDTKLEAAEQGCKEQMLHTCGHNMRRKFRSLHYLGLTPFFFNF